jgi:putative hydrolase of the HAD superfamily
MTAAVVDWQRTRAVVFDVDGTLYEQRAMRLRMARELAWSCLLSPSTLREARILSAFRRRREQLAEEEASDITRLQYERPARQLRLPRQRVEAVVREWILERPLRHVDACRRDGVRRLFDALRAADRRIGVWSDYPATGKLAAMNLAADAVVAATDPEVDCMKPRPEGLARVLELLDVSPDAALMIGDRDERDGETARRLGCPYLLLSRQPEGPQEIAGFADLLRSLPSAD